MRPLLIYERRGSKDNDCCGNAYDEWFYILKNMVDMKRIPYDMTAKEAFAKLDEIALIGNLCESDYYA